MTWMNRWEVEDAVNLFHQTGTPNLASASAALDNLVQWTDRHSDGWSSWPKPARAAKSLMALLQAKEKDYREDGCVSRAGESGVVEFTDATEAEMKKALAPVKAFLTRQGVEHSEVLG